RHVAGPVGGHREIRERREQARRSEPARLPDHAVVLAEPEDPPPGRPPFRSRSARGPLRVPPLPSRAATARPRGPPLAWTLALIRRLTVSLGPRRINHHAHDLRHARQEFCSQIVRTTHPPAPSTSNPCVDSSQATRRGCPWRTSRQGAMAGTG